MKKQTSKFGKGFIYNLILFASHFEREKAGTKFDYSILFNEASDHLYELTIPEQWQGKEIGKIAKQIQDLSLEIGHGKRMMENSPQVKEDFEKVVKLTKELGFLIDEELGIKPIKGNWE